MSTINVRHNGGDTETYGYIADNGYTIRREDEGFSPQGNPFANRWVMRDQNGNYVDHDQYRNDLFERHGMVSV